MAGRRCWVVYISLGSGEPIKRYLDAVEEILRSLRLMQLCFEVVERNNDRRYLVFCETEKAQQIVGCDEALADLKKMIGGWFIFVVDYDEWTKLTRGG